jgi:NOL1/NOP2/fmu family ribosome biogenesis protein
MDSGTLTRYFPKTFDLIMVDAPCSGEGMFRKDDTAIEQWSEENVAMCADRQAEILDNAALCLKDGGYIVYATCTFSLEENEMTVDAFLQRHPEFEIVPVTDRVSRFTDDGIFFDGCKCENLHYCRRFYPHKSRGEGQFMALLHSTLTPRDELKVSKKPLKESRVVTDFLDSVLTDYNRDGIIINGDKVSYFTADFKVNVQVFSYGVAVGEVKKNYIQPHHQLFMALGKHFKRKICLSPDSDELKKYLHGEEFEAECDNGWAVVTVDGCAVGGVKVSSGRAKNHYPKGLRTL